MKRIVLSVAVFAFLVITLAWWLYGRGEAAAPAASAASSGVTTRGALQGRAPNPGSAVIAIPDRTPVLPAGAPPANLAARALREQIRDSVNLRALYDQLRNSSDPTGEASYLLAEAIFECTPFIDRTTEEASARLSFVKPAPANPRRDQVLAFMVERCKGFSGMGAAFADAYRDLQRRAEVAGYGPAVLRALRLDPNRDPARADATAIQLLTAGPDPEVLFEVAQFIEARNGPTWLRRGGLADAQAWTAAWGLLQCSYGADCGPMSRPLIMACVVMSYCGLNSVEEAVLAQTRSSNTLRSAAVMRDQLAERLGNRDWAGLGFIEIAKDP
jgi:hypothetical protein